MHKFNELKKIDHRLYTDFFNSYFIPNFFATVVGASIVTNLSIDLLSHIHHTDDSQEISNAYLEIVQRHYKGVIMTNEVKYGWIESTAITDPFYATSYLSSYPIAFNIAADIYNKGSWGISAMNYLLNTTRKITTQSVLAKIKYKTIESNYLEMFRWVDQKMVQISIADKKLK
jgi:hypothetical protein